MTSAMKILIASVLFAACALAQKPASNTYPDRSGTGSPNGRDACDQAGQSYFQTDAVPGQNAWRCTAAGTPGTWSQASGPTVDVRNYGAPFTTAFQAAIAAACAAGGG